MKRRDRREMGGLSEELGTGRVDNRKERNKERNNLESTMAVDDATPRTSFSSSTNTTPGLLLPNAQFGILEPHHNSTEDVFPIQAGTWQIDKYPNYISNGFTEQVFGSTTHGGLTNDGGIGQTTDTISPGTQQPNIIPTEIPHSIDFLGNDNLNPSSPPNPSNDHLADLTSSYLQSHSQSLVHRPIPNTFSQYSPLLPPTPTLIHLVHTFFDKAPMITRTIHKMRFLDKLSVGLLSETRTEERLSSIGEGMEVVLHAICAVGSLFAAPGMTEGNGGKTAVPTIDDELGFRRWSEIDDEPTTTSDFGERHAMITKRIINGTDLTETRNNRNGEILYAIAQATQILIFFYHWKARWMEVWTMTGLLVRQFGPLGLMKGGPGTRSIIERNSMREDDVDREERSGLVWMGVIVDMAASAGSGWTGGIVLEEVEVGLCASEGDFERGGLIAENEQNLFSEDLFSR